MTKELTEKVPKYLKFCAKKRKMNEFKMEDDFKFYQNLSKKSGCAVNWHPVKRHFPSGHPVIRHIAKNSL